MTVATPAQPPRAAAVAAGRDKALAAARALEAWGARRDWTGADPYDGLNAEIPARVLRRWPLGLRLLTQLVKRSPVNVRPLLGIRPGLSAVTLAHTVSAYARNRFMPAEEARSKLSAAITRLAALQSPGFDECCWGYHFNVQTRVLSYPRTAPNTIATAFAGLALLDAHERTGDRRALDRATSAGECFLRHVPQTEAGGGAYFGYLVDDRTPIHNANLLVCALLARLSGRAGRPDMRAAAERGVAYTVAYQRAGGSWPYSEQPGLGWVDGFHAGYVLDCLLACARAGVGEVALEAWERGLAFYARELFLADGTPKYTTTAVRPIDGQCAAQAIQTFALAAGEDPTWLDHARRTFDFTLRRLARGDGAFAFQRRRLWTNRVPHPRWVQAPMLAALSHLLEASAA